MSELDHSDIRDSLVNQSRDFNGEIAALRQLGADKFDPVHLHYLQVLAHRVNAHQGSVKRILEGKLAQALVAFRAHFALAQGEARDAIDQVTPQHPHAAAELQRRLNIGDVRGVRQFIATLRTSEPCASLGDLTRYMAQHAPEPLELGFEGLVGIRPELRTTRYFRETWSKLSVDKRVTQALDQAPKNAGPINAHMLVLRSLVLMRDISPDYLNRFTSYVDTLLCLDQCEEDKQAKAKKAAEGDGSKKMKSPRARSR
jgi:hypothetical protein